MSYNIFLSSLPCHIAFSTKHILYAIHSRMKEKLLESLKTTERQNLGKKIVALLSVKDGLSYVHLVSQD